MHYTIATWKQEFSGGLRYSSTVYQALRFMARPDRARIFYYESLIASTSYDPGVKGMLMILALVAYLVEQLLESQKPCSD